MPKRKDARPTDRIVARLLYAGDSMTTRAIVRERIDSMAQAIAQLPAQDGWKASVTTDGWPMVQIEWSRAGGVNG